MLQALTTTCQQNRLCRSNKAGGKGTKVWLRHLEHGNSKVTRSGGSPIGYRIWQYSATYRGSICCWGEEGIVDAGCLGRQPVLVTSRPYKQRMGTTKSYFGGFFLKYSIFLAGAVGLQELFLSREKQASRHISCCQGFGVCEMMCQLP